VNQALLLHRCRINFAQNFRVYKFPYGNQAYIVGTSPS
jgi:hypothetical protein